MDCFEEIFDDLFVVSSSKYPNEDQRLITPSNTSSSFKFLISIKEKLTLSRERAFAFSKARSRYF